MKKLIAYSIIMCILASLYGVFSLSRPGSAQHPQVGAAKISDEYLAHRIVDLKLGETTSTSPEVMIVDENKGCWLHPYILQTAENTKFQVRRDKEGFHVIVRDERMKWTRVSLDTMDVKMRAVLIPIRTIKWEVSK